MCEDVRSTDQLTEGMHRNSLLTLCKSDDPMNQNDVRSFARKPFSSSALGKPHAMSQVMTQPKNVDQMLSQYAWKVLKPSCALDGHLTLGQLSNGEFHCTQDKRDLFERMLFVQRAECTIQNFTSSQIPSCVWEKVAMNEPEVNQKMDWSSWAVQGICKDNRWS